MTSLVLMLGTLAVFGAIGLTIAAYAGHAAKQIRKAERAASDAARRPGPPGGQP